MANTPNAVTCHDPQKAIVGAGAGGSIYLANTTEEAIKRFRPYDLAFRSRLTQPHDIPPFQDLEDNVANGPILVGSPERVIEKILHYHDAFGHQVLTISVDGLTETEQLEQLERFATEVIPVWKREIPSSVWENESILT